jgi:hypothetical protein
MNEWCDRLARAEIEKIRKRCTADELRMLLEEFMALSYQPNRLLEQFSYPGFYEQSLPFPDLQTKQAFLNSEMWTFALLLRDGART